MQMTKLISWFSALLLGGCSLLPPTPPELTPQSLGAERTQIQDVQVVVGRVVQTLRCVLSIAAGKTTVVGLTPFGGRLFTLEHSADQITWHSALPASNDVPLALPPPEQLLFAIQLAFWPEAAWQLRLQNSAWRMQTLEPGFRQLYFQGKLFAEVRQGRDPWLEPTLIIHYPLRLSLQIIPIP